MEWGKIKTILIWIFAVVNIFLFSMFFKGIYSGEELSDETVKNTVEVLSVNNVTISEKTVPKNYSSIQICNVENKYKSVSEMLDSAKEFSKSNGISYISDTNVSIRGNTFICTVNSNEKVSNFLKYTKSEMKKTGLLNDIEYTAEEKNGYIYFYLEYGNKIFYDCYLRVKCTDKGIQEIYGYNWLGDTVTEGGMAETVSPAEVLIDFSVHMGYTEKVTVTAVEAGYYIGNRDETVRVTAFPVWEIRVSDGGVYYYDMRNGDLLNGNQV